MFGRNRQINFGRMRNPRPSGEERQHKNWADFSARGKKHCLANAPDVPYMLLSLLVRVKLQRICEILWTQRKIPRTSPTCDACLHFAAASITVWLRSSAAILRTSAGWPAASAPPKPSRKRYARKSNRLGRWRVSVSRTVPAREKPMANRPFPRKSSNLSFRESHNLKVRRISYFLLRPPKRVTLPSQTTAM
jgi:hypothetical protein